MFIHSSGPDPHRSRASALLKAHPEIRGAFGRNPWTALVTLGLVAAQTTIAWVLSDAHAALIIAVAWCVGAFLSHALYAVLHEAAHHLIFPSKRWNRVVASIANAPLLVPVAASYAHFHLRHHRHLGDVRRDPDLPRPIEVRLAGNRALTKLLWQALFPLAQLLRTTAPGNDPGRAPTLRSPAVLVNWLVVAAYVVAVGMVAGGPAIAYLACSFGFTMMLHPLSARFIQEHHVVTDDHQETTSYYGPGNWVALNIGYHNEHHDFPFVAWNKLPTVRRLAHRTYESLHAHRSWTRLWWRFLRDPSLTPASRVTRNPKFTSNEHAPSAEGQPGSAAL